MKTYKFNARIESASVGSGGACIYFPYDVETEFGTKGRVPVKATFDGIPYTGSMVKYGAPQHMLGILKGIREQIGKGPGDMVEVTIQKDDAERIVEVPVELERILKKERYGSPSISSATRIRRSTSVGSPRPSAKKPALRGWPNRWRCCAAAEKRPIV